MKIIVRWALLEACAIFAAGYYIGKEVERKKLGAISEEDWKAKNGEAETKTKNYGVGYENGVFYCKVGK